MPEREIPSLVIEGGRFLAVPAWIENLPESYLLLVNTGESRCYFSSQIISRLRANFGIRPAGFTIDPDRGREFYYHLTIQVGSVRRGPVAVVDRELPTWLSVDGVLGMNWFRFVEPQVNRITLDFENETLGLGFAS